MAKSPKVTQLSPYTSASCPSVRQVSIVDLETAAEAKIDKIKIKKGRKKDKKSRKQGFLREILRNGVVGDSNKCDFIGLICFWAKNEGKN